MTKSFTYYMGNFIYTRDGLRYNFADGYTDGTTNGYHYYIRDHQGNNRVVAKYDGTIEQTTHYYPYGGILSQSTNQGVQKFKYNGKEFDNMHGLNMYDYGAGNDVTPQVRLVPQNVKGNVKPNRTNADQLIKYSDGTYSIVETKLSSKTPLSKGQKNAQEHVKKGNGKFEVRSNKGSLRKGDKIQIKEYQRENKYS